MMDVANLVVSIITLLFLVWYAVETFRLRRISQEQFTSLDRPIIVLSVKNNIELHTLDGSEFDLVIENVGTGVGLEVCIDDIEINSSTFKFDVLDVLRKGEKYVVEPYDMIDGKNISQSQRAATAFNSYFDPIQFEEVNFYFTARYKDNKGIQYSRKFKVSNGAIKFYREKVNYGG